MLDPHDDVAGDVMPRTLVLLDREAPTGAGSLRLVEGAPWEPERLESTYALQVVVNRPLTGIVVSEDELVLTG
jgi:hypothetical protein